MADLDQNKTDKDFDDEEDPTDLSDKERERLIDLRKKRHQALYWILAFFGVILFFGMLFASHERWAYIDGIYFVFITLTSVGYGDQSYFYDVGLLVNATWDQCAASATGTCSWSAGDGVTEQCDYAAEQCFCQWAGDATENAAAALRIFPTDRCAGQGTCEALPNFSCAPRAEVGSCGCTLTDNAKLMVVVSVIMGVGVISKIIQKVGVYAKLQIAHARREIVAAAKRAREQMMEELEELRGDQAVPKDRAVRSAAGGAAKKGKLKQLWSKMQNNALTKTVVLLAGLVLPLSVGALIMAAIEGWNFSDSLYFMVVTCTTVGYGDISPATSGGKCMIMFLFLILCGYTGFFMKVVGMAIEAKVTVLAEMVHKLLCKPGELVGGAAGAVMPEFLAKQSKKMLTKISEKLDAKVSDFEDDFQDLSPIKIPKLPGVREIHSLIMLGFTFGYLFIGGNVMGMFDKDRASDKPLTDYYFAFTTATTIGYGDELPQSTEGKLFIACYIYGGLVLVTSVLDAVAKVVIDRQERGLKASADREKEFLSYLDQGKNEYVLDPTGMFMMIDHDNDGVGDSYISAAEKRKADIHKEELAKTEGESKADAETQALADSNKVAGLGNRGGLAQPGVV